MNATEAARQTAAQLAPRTDAELIDMLLHLDAMPTTTKTRMVSGWVSQALEDRHPEIGPHMDRIFVEDLSFDGTYTEALLLSLELCGIEW